jgi:2-polyprenyl-3-methyl-5-hydroxy-6-metoxy-1,4-benzoquinol methylase
MELIPASACFLCGTRHWSRVFIYLTPPGGEVRFAFSSRVPYYREIWRCDTCGHFVSLHSMDDRALYQGEYVQSTYGDGGIRRAFERINSLDPAKSDNVGRVQRILEFARKFLGDRITSSPTVLDVGSGLCVFLHRMKQAGWDGTALDLDERALAHAREVVGVKAVCADLQAAEDLGRFDLVTLNKVLEHVKDPVTLLACTARHVHDSGFVYVELPDGEAAVADGPEREEFFIDHHHVFSLASFALLARQAGFRVHRLERIREPSTKYTLFAFLTPAARSQA